MKTLNTILLLVFLVLFSSSCAQVNKPIFVNSMSVSQPYAFSTTSPWNKKISSSSVLVANSSKMITRSLGCGTNSGKIYISMTDYSVPIYFANSSVETSKTLVRFSYPWAPYTTPSPGFEAPVPIPANAIPAAGTDGHMCVIDLGNRVCWDYYQAKKTGNIWSTTYGRKWNLNGVGYNPVWNASARASGAPLLGGLVLYNEIKSGYIPHALSMSIPITNGKRMVSPPASAYQSGPIDDLAIPLGSKIRLNPNLNVNNMGLTTQAKIVAKALQEYGAYVVDCSKTCVVYAENVQNSQRSWSGILKVDSIASIPLSQLQVVSEIQIGVK